MHQAATAQNPALIQIDRTKPFNPAAFISKGWRIAEQDERSLALTEIDLSQVRLESMLKPGQNYIKGEEKLRRLKEASYIRLDAGVFLHLWQNRHMIPESWKEKTNGNTTFVYFDGTVLLNPDGNRCVLYLYWNGSRWGWRCSWLESDWFVSRPSAVLASS